MGKEREKLRAVLRPIEEINALLGEGRGCVRSCFAHEDKHPSLSFHPGHGGWECHTCHRKGDIFSLYMQKNEWTFQVALEHLLTKYGIPHDPPPEKSKFVTIQDAKLNEQLKVAFSWWTVQPKAVEFMERRYGLNLQTIKTYALFRDKGRIAIPIWKGPTGVTHNFLVRATINVRYHDVWRSYCHWTKGDETRSHRPEEITDEDIITQNYHGWDIHWPSTTGKSISIKGHGGPYVYPMQVLEDSSSLYLVGGEFKALLLNQLGLPAVCFTGGEGGVSEELLPLFAGKQVRVLFDVDGAGVRATERAGRLLVDHGATVEVGTWSDTIRESLPPKGDVTDYLQLCDWNPEAMEYLDWTPVERTPEAALAPLSTATDVPPWESLEQIDFANLVDPTRKGSWVSFKGLVSGRGESPYLVPGSITVACPSGKLERKPQCESCRLPAAKFVIQKAFTTEQQLSMVGLSIKDQAFHLSKEIGYPVKCSFPEVTTQDSAVEVVVLSPQVDNVNSQRPVSGSDKDLEFEFATRTSYLVSEQRIDIRENTTYEFRGQLLPNPRDNRFTTAIRGFRVCDGDIFHVPYHEPTDLALRDVLAGSDPAAVVSRVVEDLADNVTHIYGQPEMSKAILLSMFLPFSFQLGQEHSERVCPAVMVLGDTTVGKSTVAKNYLRHFGAGRYKTMDSDPTFAGLIGGNVPNGNRFAFTWGLLPTSHRGWLGLEEFQKLPPEQIGKFTNTLSSGVAERTTVTGPKSTLCHVRLLYLTNPRGERPLSVLDPYEAAVHVMHTAQDLGRLEYLHIQQSLSSDEYHYFTEDRTERAPHRYTRELARYHLGWVWGLTSDRIKFEDASYLKLRAGQLAARFGNNVLLLPTIARWKLARLAVGFAALVYARGPDGDCVVGKEHVECAYQFVSKNYESFLKVNEAVDSLPSDIFHFLQTVPKVRPLRSLVNSEYFTREDLTDYLGAMASTMFMEIFHINHSAISRQSGRFRFKSENLKAKLLSYCADRERAAKEEHGKR